MEADPSKQQAPGVPAAEGQPSTAEGDVDVGDEQVAKGSGGFLRHVLAVSTGSVLVQALGIIATPILSRLFSPEAIGIAGVYGSIVGMAAIVACARYDAAIMLPRRDEDAASLVGLSVLLALASTLLVGVLVVLGGGPLLNLLNLGTLVEHGWVLPLGLLLLALAQPLTYWNQRLRKFDRLTGARVLAALSNTFATLGTGAMGFVLGVHLLLARALSGFLALPLLLVLFGLRSDVRFILRHCTLARMRAMASRYRHFPLGNLWASLLDAVARESPSVLLAAFFDPAVAGLYALSSRLLRIPGQFISTAISDVLFERTAVARAAGRDMGPLVESVCRRLITIGLLPILAVGVTGPDLFGLIFGPEWADAGLYTLILAPSVLAMFFSSPVTVLLPVLELHRFNALSQLALFIVYVGALVLGKLTLQGPAATLALFSAATTVAIVWRLGFLLRAAGARTTAVMRHFALHFTFSVPPLAAYAVARWGFDFPLAPSLAILVVLSVPYPVLALRADRGLQDALRAVLRKIGEFLPVRDT